MAKSIAAGGPVKFTPKDVFIHAWRYEFGAILLRRHTVIHFRVPSNNYSAAASYSGMTCAAFAVELYLKSLVFSDSAKFRSDLRHHVLNLYQATRPERQKRIGEIFEEEFAKDESLVRHRVLSAANPKELREFTIEGALETSSDAFEKLRYAFEGIQKGPLMPGLLCVACRRTILEIKPEWSRLVVADLNTISS